MKIIEKPISFLKDVKAELSKVSWSTRQEVTGTTFVVIMVTSLMAFFIGIVDFLLSKGVSLVFLR